MRDAMLAEAKRKKEAEAQEQRSKEIEFMSNLKRELDHERETKVQKKINEREQA